MSDEQVFGPDGPDGGVFEGVFEFDCLELVSPELRAKARPGKWVRMNGQPEGINKPADPDTDFPGDAPPPAGG